MPLRTGTYDISTLLAARFASAARYGLDTIAQIIQNDIDVHNRIVGDMMGELADITADRQRISGSSLSGTMVEVDEFGRGPTQRDLPGSTVGFPLRKYQFPIGWTQTWLRNHTPADMAIATGAAEKAHLRRIRAEIQRAIYTPTNYSFQDYLVDNIAFPVKALLNADSTPIPEGPNGEVFVAATHTHYTGTATLTTAGATALVNNVIEHGFGGQVRIVINAADDAAWRALTGFSAYLDPRLSIGYPQTFTPGQRLDITRLDNRAIGIYGAAEVWVKPWGIANYAFAYDVTATAKPLVMRQREDAQMQGLRIAAEIETYPLYAQYMEVEFGIGVWARSNGAVYQYNNATYTAPTITV